MKLKKCPPFDLKWLMEPAQTCSVTQIASIDMFKIIGSTPTVQMKLILIFQNKCKMI